MRKSVSSFFEVCPLSFVDAKEEHAGVDLKDALDERLLVTGAVRESEATTQECIPALSVPIAVEFCINCVTDADNPALAETSTPRWKFAFAQKPLLSRLRLCP